MKGNQCHKALYLNKYHRELQDEISDQQQAIFSSGTNIGELAQELFPGGVDATPESYYNFQASVKDTAEYIANGEKVIYEAAFQYQGVLCALDILVKKRGKWYAYEVKSSTSVKGPYILDTALQYYVITNSGIELADMSVVHINNKYKRKGPVDVHQLFTIESVLDQILPRQANIPKKIRELKRVLKGKDVPVMDIGEHCHIPYPCNFLGHCWKHIPEERSVFKLGNSRGKEWDLYKKGIYAMEDIPDDYPLNKNQRLQVNGWKHGKTHIDKQGIKEFLKTVRYPMYFFDFETIRPIVPMWNNSVPFQQVPFQYSLHYQGRKNSKLQHFEFLAEHEGAKDPRIALLEQLIEETKKPGDIWVYNIGFERARMNEFAKYFPKYKKEALAIADRLRDLIIPFQQKLYYTPEMDGHHGLKYVLPALVPDLSYNDLEIQEGGTASVTFDAMISGTFDGDVEKTRTELLEYCKLDTYAMVRIMEKLRKL